MYILGEAEGCVWGGGGGGGRGGGANLNADMPHTRKRKLKEHHITVRAVLRDDPDLKLLARSIIAVATAELAARQASVRTKGSGTHRHSPVMPSAQSDTSTPQGHHARGPNSGRRRLAEIHLAAPTGRLNRYQK